MTDCYDRWWIVTDSDGLGQIIVANYRDKFVKDCDRFRHYNPD